MRRYMLICEYGSLKPIKSGDVVRLLGGEPLSETINDGFKILYRESNNSNVNQYATDALGREVRGPIVRVIE